MSANTQVPLGEMTLSEIEAMLELSSRDPDAPHCERMGASLRRAAVNGALTGLAWGGPARHAGADISVHPFAPESALELGSDTHDDFLH